VGGLVGWNEGSLNTNHIVGLTVSNPNINPTLDTPPNTYPTGRLIGFTSQHWTNWNNTYERVGCFLPAVGINQGVSGQMIGLSLPLLPIEDDTDEDYEDDQDEPDYPYTPDLKDPEDDTPPDLKPEEDDEEPIDNEQDEQDGEPDKDEYLKEPEAEEETAPDEELDEEPDDESSDPELSTSEAPEELSFEKPIEDMYEFGLGTEPEGPLRSIY